MSSSVIKEIVRQTLRMYRMAEPGQTILVALSGGPDSVCLLHLLQTEGYRVHALYVDHRLRPLEIPLEINFCADLCRTLGVEFRVACLDPVTGNSNRQARYRELRYRKLEREATRIGADKIALGHHLDDLAETTMLNLLRGAGTAGLSSIPPVRDKYIRPLISLARAQIMTYLHEAGVGYLVDSSNLKDGYRRNHLRHHLMPVLRQYNPDISTTLGRSARILREDNEFLEKLAGNALEEILLQCSEETVELSLAPLASLDQALLRRVLKQAVALVDPRCDIGFEHVEDIIHLARSGRTGAVICLPGRIRVFRSYKTLVVTKKMQAMLEAAILPVPGEIFLYEKDMAIRAAFTGQPVQVTGPHEACFCADHIETPLIVRKRQAGDFFYPLGFGKRKKIQDFFVDEKIPSSQRDSIPLVYSGKDLLWVAGYRGDDRFKITQKSTKFVTLVMLPAGRR